MKQGKWIRWIGVVATTTALAIIVLHSDFFTGRHPDDFDVLIYLGIAVVPCFVTIFLVAFARFWWAFAFGLWISFLAIMICLDENASPISVLLVLCAATICATPFLNLPYRSKKTARDGVSTITN